MRSFFTILLAAVLLSAAACNAGLPDPADTDITDLQTNADCTDTTAPDTPADGESGPAMPEEIPPKEVPYMLRVSRPDLSIYAGPGYDYADTGVLVEPGVYTVVEESADNEGYRWGKLKSGAGWIDLGKAGTDAPNIPITFSRTPAAKVAGTDCHLHTVEQTPYTQWLTFHAQETLTDLRFTFMDIGDGGLTEGRELYTRGTLTEEKPLIVGVVFYGDLTTYGLTFTDSAGEVHRYILYTSGRNGSVVMKEKSE